MFTTFILILGLFTSPAQAQPQVTPATFTPLSGLYTGTLTYTDYQGGELVTMPLVANLTVKDNDLKFNIEINEGGKRYAQDYTYTVRNGGIKGYTVITHEPENGMLVLTSEGRDAKRPARFRHTMMYSDEGVRITKEVKFLDEPTAEFFIRNQYTYERMVTGGKPEPSYAAIDGSDVGTANVTIPAGQVFVLGENEKNGYRVQLMNTSALEIKVGIYSKASGERTGGFGLAPYGKTKLKVGADQVIHLINDNEEEVVVRGKLSRNVEGMRYRDLD